MALMSEPHTPEAATLTRTSPARGASTSTSAISMGAPNSRSTAARIVVIIAPRKIVAAAKTTPSICLVERGRSVSTFRAHHGVGEGMELDADFVAFVRGRGEHHLRTAVLLTGDWHAAEDLTQTALAKLYRVWSRLDTAEDPDAYLRRILVNTHRSWWRSRWRRELPVAAFPDSPSPADMADRHALAATVRQALRTLPARQRTALVLRF